MGDIKINRSQLTEFPETVIEGVGTNIMLVVPVSALPRHVPSILMFLYETARTLEQDGRMLSFTLRVIDDSGNVIKERKKLTIPRVKYEEFDDQLPDNYGFGEGCKKGEAGICYDVNGVKDIVFDLLEGARKAYADEPPPPVEAASLPIEFPEEIMADFNSLSVSEQDLAKDGYGLLTVLFNTSDKDINLERTPPGGLLIVDLPAWKTEYPANARGIGLGAFGTRLLSALSTPTPCEEVQKLNRLLMMVKDNNGGTKLLNDVRRFVEGSLVFQMASRSGECSLKAANEGLVALFKNCAENDEEPRFLCEDSLRDDLALYEKLPSDELFPRVPAPNELIGDPAAYYELMSELSKKDRNAAIASVSVAMDTAVPVTDLDYAYHHYLTQMNVTVSEAFKAILNNGEMSNNGLEVVKFLEPVFENLKQLGPKERMRELAMFREELIRFAARDNTADIMRWEKIAHFTYGIFRALDGDAPARRLLAEAVIDSLCMIDKGKYSLSRGPDKLALRIFFETLLRPESGEYLQNNPGQAVRLFKWMASLTSAFAIKRVNDDESLMLILWNGLGQDDKDSLTEVVARSVAEQIICAYLNMQMLWPEEKDRKLGIGYDKGFFPNLKEILGVDGMAAVAVAVANSEKTRNALGITLLPVIEAVMDGRNTPEDRLHFVGRLMKGSKEPHIVAALILNCFRALDNVTWRWTAGERIQLVRSISNILDERASFIEDLPLVGPPADMELSRHVRHVFRAMADGDVEELLRLTLRNEDGGSDTNFSFVTQIPMTVVPMDDWGIGGERPIHLDYEYAPSKLARVVSSFGTLSWLTFHANKWNFWEDFPPTERSFADAIKASYRLAEGNGAEKASLDFLLRFIGRDSNNIFYNDTLIGDFLEEKIVGSLKELEKNGRISAWAVFASSLSKLMPLERRLRVLKAVSADYVTAAEKARDGLPLGPISYVMGKAARGMNSVEELEIVLPIINLVGNKLNIDIPGDDDGFIGIITGMANVIGMLDEEAQVKVIGRVFDECMIALRGDTLKLFDRLFEPQEGETKHPDGFSRRVGRRLAASKATAYAHLFLENYAAREKEDESDPYEKRFDHAQEMALGAVSAYFDKNATATFRDLQKMIFVISNNIIFEGSSESGFLVGRTSSWIASLGEVGTGELLLVAVRPLIQFFQSAKLPSPRGYEIEERLKAVAPNFGQIVELILKSDKLTPKNRIALADRFLQVADTCVKEGWTLETKGSGQYDLAGQCRKIQELCR